MSGQLAEALPGVKDLPAQGAHSSPLLTFLLGTLDAAHPLRRLRGNRDVLQQIWEMACEEWWELHIDRYPRDIPNLEATHFSRSRGVDYPYLRKQSGGCPVATMKEDMLFPPPVTVPAGTFQGQRGDQLYVNMMPISILDLDTTLPSICQQYRPLIEECVRKRGWRRDSNANDIVYLTIDERIVEYDQPQRRGGLHVESPGVLPIWPRKAAPGDRFVPGAEHRWGGGLMMRDETVVGGIYMASNVSDSCAIWNAKIHDTDGTIIGPHGDIEKMRSLLGPPTMLLKAGQLVWFTDKTPHESLPVPRGTRRQFFRLVTGEITAWFSDHCTANPCGVSPPMKVRIVNGDKFSLFHNLKPAWDSGTPSSIAKLYKENQLREILYDFDLGHIADALIGSGYYSLDNLKQFPPELDKLKSLMPEMESFGANFHELPKFGELLHA